MSRWKRSMRTFFASFMRWGEPLFHQQILEWREKKKRKFANGRPTTDILKVFTIVGCLILLVILLQKRWIIFLIREVVDPNKKSKQRPPLQQRRALLSWVPLPFRFEAVLLRGFFSFCFFLCTHRLGGNGPAVSTIRALCFDALLPPGAVYWA